MFKVGRHPPEPMWSIYDTKRGKGISSTREDYESERRNSLMMRLEISHGNG